MIVAGKLKYLLIVSFLFILSYPVIAQIQGLGTGNTPNGKHAGETDIPANVRSDNYLSSTAGEVYVDDSWKRADVTLNENGQVITDIPVRLDVYSNLLEMKRDGKVMTLSSANVREITIDSEHTTYITEALLRKNAPKGFYRLIYNDQSSVLCHYYTEIRQSNYNRALDMGERKDAIVLMKDYYFLFNGKLIKLEDRRKSLARQFDKNDWIYDYILSEKINPKNEFDLVKLAHFCDGLNGSS